jgi:hypothetical protein
MNDILVLIILSLACIWAVYYISARTSIISTFASYMGSIELAPLCYDYFLTDGWGYYLIASKRPFTRTSNPLFFDSLREANDYLRDNNCDPLPLTYMVKPPIHKSRRPDVPVVYTRECAKELAHNDFNADICGLYSVDNSDPDAIIKKLRAIDNEIDTNKAKYDMSACMTAKIESEYPELVAQSL